MAIDLYFSNRTLGECGQALCREQRRDVLAVHEWVEGPAGGRRDERVIRLRAGSPPPAMSDFAGRWPAGPSETHYAVCLTGAAYDGEGQLAAEFVPPRFLGFLSRAEFEERARAARDADLVTTWTELQGLPAPRGTRFTSHADAICHQCLVKDLAWSNCSPRLCPASGLAYLAAGLALALDRSRTDSSAHIRDTLKELLDYYEIKPHAPTPRLDALRARRLQEETLDADAESAIWPAGHPLAGALLEALICRSGPLGAEEAGFLLARLLVLTHLLSQIVEEQEGQAKRLAYRALTLLGTYVRALRIAQRFTLELAVLT
jgi:hypothetical protein